MITTKIFVEPYVAEYIKGKFYDDEKGAVHFPASSDIYVTIFDLLQKRPVELRPETGNIEFCLPDRREGKNPEIYNYLSQRSSQIISNKMKVMMWAELHDFMDENKHINGIQFKESVYVFMVRYGIESITEDALIKNYQRWRDKLRRKKKRAYTKR